MTTIPTVADAKKTLVPPLKFGDETQIAALEILSAVEECVDAIWACEHEPRGIRNGGKCRTCSGSGDCACDNCGHTHTCKACDGSRKGNVLCECLSEFRCDVLREALEKAGLDRDEETAIEDAI